MKERGAQPHAASYSLKGRCECRSMAGANESRLAMRARERDYYRAVKYNWNVRSYLL